ncbi:MAG: hypothetical protein JRG94_19770 [Deltaproteobacteria bacterium]|nr:hypothetical protein [Deltaproteobacteria bacterium]
MDRANGRNKACSWHQRLGVSGSGSVSAFDHVVAYVEGFLNPFVVWNALPFGLGFGFVGQAERANRPLAAAVGFSIGAGGLSLLFHCAWLLGWHREWQLDLGYRIPFPACLRSRSRRNRQGDWPWSRPPTQPGRVTA